ncbi:MAG: heavy metal-associated domain-containing protein [Planctomycetota bacterium]|nr:heavy metal-associated domain-containing protein [Planctomycetota bacterium]MEE2894804.1 heavy metal-associated domain-containing protein [Planctomycetota bacterium]
MIRLALLTACTLAVATGCNHTPGDEPTTTAATESSADTAVETTLVVFSVKGMHCEGCANAIATKAGRVDGVQSCDVDLEAETATIAVAPGSIDEVESAIASLGYDVSPAAMPETAEDTPEAG